MEVTGATHTDRGRVRRDNQDSFGFSPEIGLYLVADGMGGHAGGQRASQEAVRAVVESVGASVADGRDGGERLREAIAVANARVWQLAEAEPALHGMGTTVVAILVEDDVAHIGHVGDSRLYRVRGGVIESLTADHSYLAALAGEGIAIDPQIEARYASLLTRAVGVAPTVEIDISRQPILDGDAFLLCSDGVYRMVAEQELAGLVAASAVDPQATCATIVERANAAGGTDNSTVILLWAIAGSGQAP